MKNEARLNRREEEGDDLVNCCCDRQCRSREWIERIKGRKEGKKRKKGTALK